MLSCLVVLFWFVFLFIFFIGSSRLLLCLLVLEIIAFYLIFIFCLVSSPFYLVEFYLVVLFCVFVIEGVIALSSLILLVSFTGSDYVGSLSFLKF